MARRRWIANEWDERTATLRGARAAHLARVLRAEPGQRFEVVTGERVWLGEIVAAREDAVRFALVEELPAQAGALPLTLLLAVWKFDRMEWAIEKTTELGVAAIVPVVARRTEKHLAQAAAARVARWKRIAEEAARQSRRVDVPAIHEPCPLREAVAQHAPAVRLLMDEAERARSVGEALGEPGGELPGSVAAAIGPEGGWAEEERGLFADAGWVGVSLGPRILRAETAAVVAAALVGAWL